MTDDPFKKMMAEETATQQRKRQDARDLEVAILRQLLAEHLAWYDGKSIGRDGEDDLIARTRRALSSGTGGGTENG